MPSSSPSALSPCPCGRTGPANRPLSLSACCGRFIDDFHTTPAPDAESLMRSRYTAFVLERADYLLATWQAVRRPPSIGFDAGVRWLGLEVRHHRVIDGARAEVEFVARQKSAGSPALRLHERSRFVRDGEGAGRWYYVDGDQL